jgi:Ca2+-binding RTX toxin-like protein
VTSRSLPRKAIEMRRIVLLTASMALTLLLASGVALALNTIRCDGGKCNGTPRNDRMLGTAKRDIMYGFKGEDSLLGEGGNDDLYGFDGRDVIIGDAGADKVSGSDGIDSLSGGGGPDSLNGGNGVDYLYNGPGNDRVFGGPDGSSDELYMAGRDAGGDDLFNGGDGADAYLLGYYPYNNWGHATISDSDANPAPGQSVTRGDSIGADMYSSKDLTISLSPGPGPEVTDNRGTNTVEWSAAGEFFRVYGGEGDDTITGDGWRNVLFGEGGTNTISGRGGNDNVISDGNGGSLSGGDGNDLLSGFRAATLRGGNGDDVIYPMSSPDDPPPVLTSYTEGGAGDDEISAQNASPDVIDCGDGTDTVTYDEMDTVTNCEDASTG